MIIALLAGLGLGFILGLAFAVWLVTTAGYEWSLILHRWKIELLARRYRDEVDQIGDG